LLIDFTRAFDVVDRTILLRKVHSLNLPHCVKCWIASFLSNRSQRVICNGRTSYTLPVNLGVVQGSALGPTLFTVMVSDLKPLSSTNDLIKFADDMTLLVPESTDVDISVEFNAIKTWAANNKLIINFEKTKELVFHRPKPAKPLLPPILSGIERVTIFKLLGVYLKENLSFSAHVDFIISQCQQRMFLLRAMRNRGLPPGPLIAVFKALIVSRILYAVSSWGGFLNANEKQRLNTVFLKCTKYRYCDKMSTFEDLLDHADRVLFCKAQNTNHCLSHMLPAIRSTTSVLRERGHPYVLPCCKRDLFKRSFLVRALYNFI
jgi:hypothetical protein